VARNKKTPAVKIKTIPKPAKAKKSKKAVGEAERDPLVRDLPCELSMDEREVHSMKASELSYERKTLLSEMKRRDKEDRQKLKALATDIERLSDEAATGFETVPVQCSEEIDGEDVKLVRTDTGEEVERRPITPEEATRDLFEGREDSDE
jgi:hypothetical protein